MNGIIHNCTHPPSSEGDASFRLTEQQMVLAIFAYIDHLFSKIKPRKVRLRTDLSRSWGACVGDGGTGVVRMESASGWVACFPTAFSGWHVTAGCRAIPRAEIPLSMYTGMPECRLESLLVHGITHRALLGCLAHLNRLPLPLQVFFMAVDGVAPRAKMNQQRSRRFRTAQEAKELAEKARRKGEEEPETAAFDSNCITPGGLPFHLVLFLGGELTCKYAYLRNTLHGPTLQSPSILCEQEDRRGC